jgi:hypothetical protein
MMCHYSVITRQLQIDYQLTSMLFLEAPSTCTYNAITLQSIFHLVLGDVNYRLTVLQRKFLLLKSLFCGHIFGPGSRATFFCPKYTQGVCCAPRSTYKM